jgi:hypothetical protein
LNGSEENEERSQQLFYMGWADFSVTEKAPSK